MKIFRRSAKPKVAKPPLRQRIGLATIVTIIAVVVIAGSSAIAGAYALQTLYENKLRDTWAIVFLDLETLAGRIRAQLSAFEGQARTSRPDQIFEYRPGSKKLVPVAGETAKPFPIGDFSRGDLAFADRLVILVRDGEPFLARTSAPARPTEAELPHQVVRLSKIPDGFWLSRNPALSGSTIYILTKDGKLAFSTDMGISDGNVGKRQLVQSFVAAPFTQGQMQVQTPEGKTAYGFYHEVPETNLVLFCEVGRDFALREVQAVALKFAGFVAFLVFAALFILQFPLQTVVRPLKELVQLMTQVGQGNFVAQPSHRGLGEVAVLNAAVMSMSQNLYARDQAIFALQEEQKTKIRLQQELAIARRIQDNLMPSREDLAKVKGLGVKACYLPATEVAGDWYGQYFNEDTRELVVAIADVSGHGTGSAMFTAVIAALFEEARLGATAGFPMQQFAERVNAVVLRLGKKEWHATLQVVRVLPGGKTIEILSAGHCFPMLVKKSDGSPEVETLPARSDILGLLPTPLLSFRTYEVESGDYVVCYTDGLTEARSTANKMYGSRRLRKVLCARFHSENDLIAAVLKDWHGYTDGAEQADDVCLIAVRMAV